MKTRQFSEEVDDLVENGYLSIEEYEIGMESFYHLRNIRKQISFLKKISLAFAIIATLCLITTTLLLFSGRTGSTTLDGTSSNLSSSIVDTIEHLKSENQMLKEKISSLSKEIKLAKEQLAKGNEPEAEQKSKSKIAYSGSQSTRELIRYHEVKAGETLAAIAKKYYGDAKMADKIISDNNLRGASDIHEGKQLKIIL